MTDYEYDKDLPYVVVDDEGQVARFESFEHAEWFADMHETTVIDTTPKPRVPADAKYITWLVNGRARWFAERRIGGWAVEGATYGPLEDLPGVTPDTVFTVLEERKN